MKTRRLNLFLIIFMFCSESCIFGADTDSSEKKHILENMKKMQEAYQISGFDEKKYEDLCMMGIFYFNNAVMERDMNDARYKEDINKAIEFYQKAITVNSKSTGAYKGLFSAYLFLGDEQNALRNVNKAIENNANDFDALFMLGNFYYNKADYKNAFVWLERAEKIVKTKQHVLAESEYKGFKKMIDKVRKQTEK